MKQETRFVIIDYDKRYIELTKICDMCSGYCQFSKWEDKGDYIQCNGRWIQCFDGGYLYIMHKYGLYYLSGNNFESVFPFIKPSQRTITNPMTALNYIVMNYYVPLG